MLQMILVQNGTETRSAVRYAKLHSEEYSINLGLPANRIPVCVKYIGTWNTSKYIGQEVHLLASSTSEYLELETGVLTTWKSRVVILHD